MGEQTYLYTNYIDFQEIWHIVVPHRSMYEYFRQVEKEHGLTQLGRLIYEKCHWPKRPDTRWFNLLRTKMEKYDTDQYFLIWTPRRFQPKAEEPPVIKTHSGLGLYPVIVLTSGFVMDPNANNDDKGGNRLIERI